MIKFARSSHQLLQSGSQLIEESNHDAPKGILFISSAPTLFLHHNILRRSLRVVPNSSAMLFGRESRCLKFFLLSGLHTPSMLLQGSGIISARPMQTSLVNGAPKARPKDLSSFAKRPQSHVNHHHILGGRIGISYALE
jgi:hypothetical protein